jgi:serine/threonine protein kinase
VALLAIGTQMRHLDGTNAGEDGARREPTETDLEATFDEAASSMGQSLPGELAELPVRSRGRYELLGEHARGGLGKILKAHDKELGRTLAIKQMRAPDHDMAVRFTREALITARLEHPAIVPVHDAGRWESGEPFYAMKFVSGKTLKDVVLEKTTLSQRLSLLPSIIAVADAIAYAHAQGIIHRDLKASNVLLGAFGETIVIDWGLAKELTRKDPSKDNEAGPYRIDADFTIAGAVVGTPSFMPPEQARGEEVDERADVYAIGALLYYTLTSVAPHEGKSNAEVLDRVRTESPIPLSERARGVQPDLAAIVAKAMARDRAERYAGAQELARDLKLFQAGQIVTAHAYSWAELFTRWVRKHRAIAALTTLFVLLGAAGIAAFVLREQRLRRNKDAPSSPRAICSAPRST